MYQIMYQIKKHLTILYAKCLIIRAFYRDRTNDLLITSQFKAENRHK
jgi:hypothetical protein